MNYTDSVEGWHSGKEWIDGGTLTSDASGELDVGGFFNGNANARGVLNVGGNGSVSVLGNNALALGRWTSNTGTVNQSGGTVTISAASSDGLWLAPGGDPGASGTYNLDGGTLVTPDITPDGGDGTKAFAFGAGTLQANAAFTVEAAPNFTTTIGALTGTVDTAGFDVTWAADLTTAAWGGLDKEGLGTLTLSGTNVLGSLLVNGGTVTIDGDTVVSGNVANVFYVGNRTGTDGTIVLEDGGSLTIAGEFADDIVVGRDGGTGTFIQNGGVLTFSGSTPFDYFYVGAASNAAEALTYTINDGTFDLAGNKLGVGLGTLQGTITGILAQAGGAITDVYELHLGPLGTGVGEGQFTMTGGDITIGSGGIISLSGNYAISLGGGTVHASAPWSSALDMALSGTGGDTTFDTSGGDITLSGSLSGAGGLSKTGAGALTLNTAGTFSGSVRAVGGSLVAGASGALAGCTNLTVETAGSVTLDADDTLNDAVDLNLNGSGSMVLNNATPQVVRALYFDGTPQAKGTWGAPFSGANNEDPRFSGTGFISIANDPTTIFRFK